MARVLAGLALLVFVASAAAHLATFVPGVTLPTDRVLLLHFAAMAVFAPACFLRAPVLGPRTPWWGRFDNPLEQWQGQWRDQTRLWSALKRCVPPAGLAAFAFLFAYAFLNFALFASADHPTEMGKDRTRFYVTSLSSPGPAREVSAGEYARGNARRPRLLRTLDDLFLLSAPLLHLRLPRPTRYRGKRGWL